MSNEPVGSTERPLSNGLVLLMAVVAGAAVANIYYAQPLLSTIAHDFSVSDGTAGLIVTASQVGYAAGLVLLVPLGDLLERRRLITRIMLVTALALAATAASPSFTLLAAALVVVGLTSVVAQILVPMASMLAAEHERGRVVGNVMSGLLVGILVARTASGLIAQAGGWRLVFGVSAALMLVLCGRAARGAAGSAPHDHAFLSGAAAVGRTARDRAADAASPHGLRRARDGPVQRSVDDDRLFALRLALPLRRRHDRPVRSRRARWSPCGPGGGTTG